MRRRTRIHKKKQPHKPKLKEELIHIGNEILDSHNNERLHNEQQAITRIKSDSKFFFQYASKQSKLKKSVGPLTNKQGNLTHNTDDICDILQSQYLSVFTTPSTSHHIPDIRDFFTTEQNENHIRDNVNITIQDVHLAIKQMPRNAAAGPDGLPSSMFHNCAKELFLPLCIFYK